MGVKRLDDGRIVVGVMEEKKAARKKGAEAKENKAPEEGKESKESK